MPSYKNDVAPIIQARCLKCHSPGGQEAVRDYTTYQGVYFYRQSILTRVHDCTMPPQGESPPDSQERALLFGWLVCGAPNN
jgi:hypothetical protein